MSDGTGDGMDRMQVVATAGHIDHGKSTLLHALTGADPDRLDDERRRGLTIELGYCWTDLPDDGTDAGTVDGTVAFVDVPGHERFISTMLAGVGPVPACLLVVAADDPWMPQAAEHLRALDVLGVRHGVVAVNRSDLADPAPMMQQVREKLAGTSLAETPVLPVSAVTGAGTTELRSALARMASALPHPDPDADVRLWTDRRFIIDGVGTVVTGTLPAGTIKVGDELSAVGGTVRVRGIQTLKSDRASASGIARVALNVTGDVETVDRVLWHPDAWITTTLVDVRLRGGPGQLPSQPVLHVGSAALTVHARPLDDTHARLRLDGAVPLRPGDRAVLRDPGNRRLWGITVLDPIPPQLKRRGAAAERAENLAAIDGLGTADSEVERRGIVDALTLRRLGIAAEPTAGQKWFMSDGYKATMQSAIARAVSEHDQRDPLDPGVPSEALAGQIGLPSADLVYALVPPGMRIERGRVLAATQHALPSRILTALAELDDGFTAEPFAAPTADRLAELGLSRKDLGAAARSGRVLQPEPGIVLPADAADRATRLLTGLPQPFTTSQARQLLATSRRVTIPLLDYLDRQGLTKRLPDDRRTVQSYADE